MCGAFIFAWAVHGKVIVKVKVKVKVRRGSG
jgi:hypothetical protein